MLKRILIANRGEIAVRIIRACRELSVETIAVYTESDREELHTMLADRAVCIGRDRPESGYLNMENIIEAAKLTGCDAIHPGFGFLSENPRFAEMCEENDIVFIGPNSSVISLLGDKIRARQIVSQAGVSIVPGSDGPLPGIEEAKQCARKIGYPVMIKASAGGGGRGIRRAESEEELENAMMEAKTEAEVSFGDGTIYMEKLITDPKHIEFQILADSFGNIIHLGDRNCCVQRRNQKMLEEAPDFRLSDEMRTKMGRDAVLAAKTAGYENAGTVEFIVDGSDYYFIEMNTRLQVEHPVTEMITGTDIVKQQIRIASGLRLNMAQQDIVIRGHSIECRVCAEDIYNDYAPDPSEINFLHLPSGLGVRVESALYSGMRISPFYDSVILKVITYGDTRLEAVRRMRRALGETIIRGCKTNLPVLQLILYNREFLRGDYNTGFMEKHGDHLLELYDAAGGRLNESV
jgi:acetyl-CoA carboxylase biotin carboxylase subunit